MNRLSLFIALCQAVTIGIAANPESHQLHGFDDKEIKISSTLNVTGHLLSVAPFFLAIVAAVHTFSKADGSTFKQKFLVSISPTDEHREIVSSGNGARRSLNHYLYLYAVPLDRDPNQRGCFRFSRRQKVAPDETVTESTEPPSKSDDHQRISTGSTSSVKEQVPTTRVFPPDKEDRATELSGPKPKISITSLDKDKDSSQKAKKSLQDKIQDKILDKIQDKIEKPAGEPAPTSGTAQNKKLKPNDFDPDKIVKDLLGEPTDNGRRGSGGSGARNRKRRNSSTGGSKKVGNCAQQ